jgi:ATP-binding cassette, subfamily A (ABC1), member 5
MVSGHLQCIGSSQHLKSRFGAGYQLDVSFPSQTLKQQFLIQFCSTQQPIPVSSPSDLSHTEDTKQQQEETVQGMGGNDNPLRGLVVEEEHPHYLRCKLTNEIDLAEAFTCLERLKTQQGDSAGGEGGMIADYSLSQATLEQIFINFAKHQEEEQHPHPQAPRPAEALSQQPSQQERAGGAAPISESQATD